MVLEIILIVFIVALIIALIWQISSIQKFNEQRDMLYETLLDIHRVINTNAAIQEKGTIRLNQLIVEFDALEKISNIHSTALKIYGPTLAKFMNEEPIPDVAKSKNLED
jgi:hypothetical protein